MAETNKKKLVWDKTGERRYETGVSQGVVYPIQAGGLYSMGYAWNGLSGVTESPSGAEPSAIYADNIKYLNLNKKTQVITPSLLGEMVYDVVDHSIRQLLNPELTASWEKGLTYVAEGFITSGEYMEKLERFVAGRTVNVIRLNNQYDLRGLFDAAAVFYKQKTEHALIRAEALTEQQ